MKHLLLLFLIAMANIAILAQEELTPIDIGEVDGMKFAVYYLRSDYSSFGSSYRSSCSQYWIGIQFIKNGTILEADSITGSSEKPYLNKMNRADLLHTGTTIIIKYKKCVSIRHVIVWK